MGDRATPPRVPGRAPGRRAAFQLQALVCAEVPSVLRARPTVKRVFIPTHGKVVDIINKAHHLVAWLVLNFKKM